MTLFAVGLGGFLVAFGLGYFFWALGRLSVIRTLDPEKHAGEKKTLIRDMRIGKFIILLGALFMLLVGIVRLLQQF